MNQGPALQTGGSGEQKGHAPEAAAESGAEQERCKGGDEGTGQERGGGQGPRGGGGGRWLTSCSKVTMCMGVPDLLQQLLPWPEPVAGSSPQEMGVGKGGSTWVLLPLE